MGHLTGIGQSNTSIPGNPIVMAITDCANLKELSVAIRNAGTPISGRYVPDPPSFPTANVRILAADFQNLTNALTNGGRVSITYDYNDSDLKVTSFSWLPVARSVMLSSVVPDSGISSKLAPEQDTGT